MVYEHWSFENRNSLIEEPGKKYVYICVFNLKIEFSIPSKPIEESVKSRSLFNTPDFSDFKICVDDKTFHVCSINSNRFILFVRSQRASSQ